MLVIRYFNRKYHLQIFCWAKLLCLSVCHLWKESVLPQRNESARESGEGQVLKLLCSAGSMMLGHKGAP